MYSGLVFAKNKTRGLIKPTIDNISWIDDGILYAYEISQMNLKSDMVVLSACETGIGRYETGEGTRSLGLAFRYAGCNNTIMSLWKVDDKYTEELMRSFYTYLKEGKPKAEALILAKKDFVKNNETAGPFFWAAFISVLLVLNILFNFIPSVIQETENRIAENTNQNKSIST